MKTFKSSFMTYLLLMLSFTLLTGCYMDDDKQEASIQGAWVRTENSAVITVVLGNNNKGSVRYDPTANSTQVSTLDDISYTYDTEKRLLNIVGSELEGEYEVVVNATTLRLFYQSGKFYEFLRL